MKGFSDLAASRNRVLDDVLLTETASVSTWVNDSCVLVVSHNAVLEIGLLSGRESAETSAMDFSLAVEC